MTPFPLVLDDLGHDKGIDTGSGVKGDTNQSIDVRDVVGEDVMANPDGDVLGERLEIIWIGVWADE